MRFFASSTFSLRPVIYDYMSKKKKIGQQESTKLYLDSGLLLNSLLLFTGLFLFLVNIIRNVDFDTELVTKPVDTSPLRTNNPAYVLPVDLEFCRLRKPIKDKLKIRETRYVRGC